MGGGAAVAAPPPRTSVLGYTFPEWAGPPPGSFDPGLEAEVRSSQRGLLDLIEQTEREEHRQGVDVRQKNRELTRKAREGRFDIRRERGFAQADAGYQRGRLETSFARDIEDLSIARQRGEDAYNRTLTDLQHRYATEAQDRQGRSIQQGTAEEGTSSASAAVRAANQGHDTSEVNRQHAEALADLERREGRVREDYGTSMGRLQEELGRRLSGYDISGRRLGRDVTASRHQLSLAALRASQDRATKLSQAKREQAIYQTDVEQQSYYQAHQTNPSIVFPTPAAAGGGPAHAPHTNNRPPKAPGIGRAISYPPRRRRPRY